MRIPHKCPVCNGTEKRDIGTKPGSATEPCKACDKGIVWEPDTHTIGLTPHQPNAQEQTHEHEQRPPKSAHFPLRRPVGDDHALPGSDPDVRGQRRDAGQG